MLPIIIVIFGGLGGRASLDEYTEDYSVVCPEDGGRSSFEVNEFWNIKQGGHGEIETEISGDLISGSISETFPLPNSRCTLKTSTCSINIGKTELNTMGSFKAKFSLPWGYAWEYDAK